MEAEWNTFLPRINFFKLTLYHLAKLLLSEEQKNPFWHERFPYIVCFGFTFTLISNKIEFPYKIDKPWGYLEGVLLTKMTYISRMVIVDPNESQVE